MQYNGKNVRLLDCTLRDGGFYNNWDFKPDFVAAYIKECILIGVDIIEAGYIRLVGCDYGPYGQLTKDTLIKLKLLVDGVNHIAISVMIDAKEMFAFAPDDVVHKIRLDGCGADLINYIRIAVHYNDVAKCVAYLSALQAQGFKCCLNIMQIELANENELAICVAAVQRISKLEVIYIADSFGSFLPGKLQKVLELFSSNVPADIGYHGHNNLGMALVNSLCAVNSGAKWIDVTMYGMGRGAGNTHTEQFIALTQPDLDSDILNQLYEFIVSFLQPLKDKYQWGSSALYGVAGIQRIHPLYVQTMLTKVD